MNRMTLLVTAATLLLGGPHAAAAQLAGDSIRFRTQSSPLWIHGTVVGVGASDISLVTSGTPHEVPLATLTQLEVQQRKNAGTTILLMTVAGAAGFVVGDLLTRESEESCGVVIRSGSSSTVCTTESGGMGTATAAGIGAGVGLLAGVIQIGVSPFEWRAVIRR